MPEQVDMDNDTESGGAALADHRPSSGRLSKKPLILEAATNLFAVKPFREVLVDDVAREAGVGKGTVYRYFRDKDDLFFSCLKTALQSAYKAVHSVRHERGTPYSRRLARTIERLAAFYLENQRLLHIMHHHASLHGDERHQEIHELWGKLRRVVKRVVERGIEKGEFRQVDPQAATVAIHSVVRALAHDRFDPEVISHTAKSLLIEGVLNREQPIQPA